MSTETVALGAVVVVLVALSWFVVAAESAFANLSRVRLEEMADQGWRPAQGLVAMAADRARYVNVLLLTHSALTLSALAVLAVVVAQLSGWSAALSLTVATATVSLVSYVLLGVSARTVGIQHPERLAALAAPLARVLATVLTPLSTALILVGNAITPGRGYRRGPFASEAELRELVDAAGDASVIEQGERDMIHSVFELGDTIAREVMVPRTEMVYVERTKTLRQGLSLGLRSGFSRIPVIGDGPDDVVGVVFVKDLVSRIVEHRDAESTERIDSVMRPAHFVPDSKPVDELLREMQANRQHMAVVVDEFGGTAGLVTIEDILEEIVGEIADEYDTEAPDIARLPDGRMRLSARLSVEHLCAVTGMDLDADELNVETVGGLLARRLGRVPIPGATIMEQGWRLIAETAEGRRNRIATVLAEPVGDEEAG